MPDHESFKLYHFDPSLVGNVMFVVLFGIAAIGHTYLLTRRKTWYFIPFVIGCLFESVGYVGRVIAANETPNWTLSPFIIQALLILLAPALSAASIYMVLGRLIRLLDAAHHSIVRINWLTKIFVLGDVLSFLAQGAGGGILSNAKTEEDQDRGKKVILLGLTLQIIFFALFMATTVVFHIRIAREPTGRSLSLAVPWRQFIYVLYFSTFLILVRSIFRMIEYAMGPDSVLMENEVYLFVLDGVLMLLVSFIFLWYHPSKILLGYKNVDGGRVDVESRGDNFSMVPPGFEASKTYDSSDSSSPSQQPMLGQYPQRTPGQYAQSPPPHYAQRAPGQHAQRTPERYARRAREGQGY